MRGPVLALSLLIASPALADEPTPSPTATPGPTLQVGGRVDVYGAWNGNHPLDHQSFFPGTGTTAARADELSLNSAVVDLSVDPHPVGFRFIGGFGTQLDTVHEGEPPSLGPTSNPPVNPPVTLSPWRYVETAVLLWQADPTTTVMAGVYPSHVGFEGLESRDNWNYTRSWLGEFSPYYQAGVCVSHAFGEGPAPLTVQVHVMNGWQQIEAVNEGKTVGTSVSWSPPGLTLSWNTLAGPNRPGDDVDWGYLSDLYAIVKPEPLELGAAFDIGKQELPGYQMSVWQGVAGYARLHLPARTAVAVRGEMFRDPDAGVTGFRQTLAEGTLTLESRRLDHLVLKLEGRYDRSTIAIFDSSAPSREQTLVVLGAVASF